MSNPLAAICNNDNYNRSTRLLAATTLRNVLGTKVRPRLVFWTIRYPDPPQTLGEILSEREAIAEAMHHSLEAATDPWGVHVERWGLLPTTTARVEVKDVRLPQQMQRSMAAEAEATRDARAKVGQESIETRQKSCQFHFLLLAR